MNKAPAQKQLNLPPSSNAKKIQQGKGEKEINANHVETIKLNILKSNQIEQTMKDFEQNLKSCQAGKIKLIMKTVFESDKDALQFSTKIIKLINFPFRYLEWNVQGNFTDDGQAKCIGEVISRLVGLYSLSIKISNSYFADTGAKSLAKGLKKLINLHVLKVQVFQMNGKIYQKMTEIGNDSIINSILTLPNLEKLEHNFYYCAKQNFSQKLASLREYLDNQSKEMIFDENLLDNKINYIQANKNIITEIYIEMLFNPEDQKKYIDCLKYCLELPYLVKFYSNLEMEEQYGQAEEKPYQKQEEVLSKLSRLKHRQIFTIKAFQMNIREYMIFNPELILIDLFM